MTDWRAEAERLRAKLSVANSRAEQYMAERNVAQLQAQREVGETMRKLREKRDHASSLFNNIATKHARLAAWAREALPEDLQSQFFGILANGAPDWKTAPKNLGVDLLAMTAERDELAARTQELTLYAAGVEAERDELAARLEDIGLQETVAWIEHELQGTGLRHLHFERRANTLRDDVVAPVWTALIARPIQACKPEQASMSLDDALELHAIADGTKIRPACDWPGKCKHQLTSHRKKN